MKSYIWMALFSMVLFIILYKVFLNYSLESYIKKKLVTAGKDNNSRNDKKNKGLTDSILRTGKSKLERLTPNNLKQKIELLLSFSGLRWQIADVIILKVILTTGFAVEGGLLAQRLENDSLNLPLIILLGVVGFFIPDTILRSKAKSRQNEIRSALPPFIDYLTISVEAGMGLDMAISRVISKIDGPLAEEMANTLTEVKYGKSKREAFKSLTAKVNIPEFTTFLTALINGEQLGVSLSSILRIQGQQIREKKKQRVQEKAYKIPIKLAIPLVIFIFPGLLIILLGPAVISVYETLIK